MVSELREPLDLPIKSRLTVTEDDVAQGRQEVRESDDEKIRMIDARRPDYKAAIQDALLESGAAFAVYTIDDFYLINPRHHAQVIDYTHRLLRDTDLCLKVGTIRHRTRLSKTVGIRYGVQPFEDVDSLDLDRTLEDLGQTSMYL